MWVVKGDHFCLPSYVLFLPSWFIQLYFALQPSLLHSTAFCSLLMVWFLPIWSFHLYFSVLSLPLSVSDRQIPHVCRVRRPLRAGDGVLVVEGKTVCGLSPTQHATLALTSSEKGGQLLSFSWSIGWGRVPFGPGTTQERLAQGAEGSFIPKVVPGVSLYHPGTFCGDGEA